MRWLFRIFGLLDLISIYLLYPQIVEFVENWKQIPPILTSQAKVYGTLIMFISLFASAIGLFLIKKWGAIIYYFQFVCRILLWVFSIGFITLTIEKFQWSDGVFELLFKICMIAEFIRLYFTILGHRKFYLN